MTKALHILSTATHAAKHPDKPFCMDKFELYCAVLSALSWRRLCVGNSIGFVTDKRGRLFLENVGVTSAWDDITVTLPDFADSAEGLDPRMFWAAGKIYALRDTEAPVAVIDTDFILWKQPAFSDRIIAAHIEPLAPHIYPDVSYFKMKKGYIWRGDYDYSVWASNTAFLYIPDDNFKQYYAAAAIEFMKQSQPCDDYLRYMVFAEQRLLSVCAKFFAWDIDYLLPHDKLFMPQDKYTHLWGAKQAMRDDAESAAQFCGRCRFRIRADFPQYANIIDNIENYYDRLGRT